ncbi:MAG: hypothetical protein ACRENE_13130 [Polyangiaceae bacterium]
MMSREDTENVRLWLFIEDCLAEDEAARIDALSDEELGEELRHAGALGGGVQARRAVSS